MAESKSQPTNYWIECLRSITGAFKSIHDFQDGVEDDNLQAVMLATHQKLGPYGFQVLYNSIEQTMSLLEAVVGKDFRL